MSINRPLFLTRRQRLDPGMRIAAGVVAVLLLVLAGYLIAGGRPW